MGWGLRILAAMAALLFLGIGAWPVSLLALGYLVYSFSKPRVRRAVILRQESIPRRRRPWERYSFGGILFLLAFVASEVGGTFSSIVFLIGGIVVVFWPALQRSASAGKVMPVRESVLLRSRFFPFRWHTLVEVKLESRDQARGVAALDGRLLVFAGKAPSAFQAVSTYALRYRAAEEKILRRLQRESRMLSQRGAHLLPLDSEDAGQKLSLTLNRLEIGAADLEAVSSLPFDLFTLQTKEGLVVRYRAFRIVELEGMVSIPFADISLDRQPLFAEVVEEIAEKHCWPGPDEYSSFLAAMDASRNEPLTDRLRARAEEGGKMAVETPGGAEVKLTRAQLRAVARIYA